MGEGPSRMNMDDDVSEAQHICHKMEQTQCQLPLLATFKQIHCILFRFLIARNMSFLHQLITVASLDQSYSFGVNWEKNTDKEEILEWIAKLSSEK